MLNFSNTEPVDESVFVPPVPEPPIPPVPEPVLSEPLSELPPPPHAANAKPKEISKIEVLN